MKISIGTREDWELFAQTSPHATLYHTPFWADLLKEAGLAGNPECYLLEFTEDRKAFLPGMRVPRLGGLLYGWYSMPVGYYGGPLGEEDLTPQDWSEMFGWLLRDRRRTATVMSLPHSLRMPSIEIPKGVKVEEKVSHILELGGGFEKVWEERFTPRNKTSIRKAEREGLAVTNAEDESDCAAFLKLYDEASRDWDERLPETFLRLLAEAALQNPERIRFRLTKAGDRMIAGGLFLYHNRKATPFMTAYDRDYEGAATFTNLLYKEEIEHACKTSCETFDFQGSLGIRSVERFKESFGAERVTRTRIVVRRYLWNCLAKARNMLGR